MIRRPVDRVSIVANNVENLLRTTAATERPLPARVRAEFTSFATQSKAVGYETLSRLHQQLDWYHSGHVAYRCNDFEFPSNWHGAGPKLAFAGPPIAIFGNRDTHRDWNNFVPDDDHFRAREGAVMVDGIEFIGEDLAGWTLVRSPGRDVHVFFDSGARGMRLARLLALEWRGDRTETAVFRVDLDAASGWRVLSH
jgi:hypothetical protein